MTLPGPSRTIIVQPIEQPAPPEPAPEPEPEREPRAAPATPDASARPSASGSRSRLPDTATIVASDGHAADCRADPRDPGLVDRVLGCDSASLHGVTGGGWKAGGEPTVAGLQPGTARSGRRLRRHRAPEPDCGCGLYAVHPHAAQTALVLSRRSVGPAGRGRRNRRGVGAGRGARGWVPGRVRAADRDRRRRGSPGQRHRRDPRPARSPVPRRAGRGRRPSRPRRLLPRPWHGAVAPSRSLAGPEAEPRSRTERVPSSSPVEVPARRVDVSARRVGVDGVLWAGGASLVRLRRICSG